MKTTRSSATKTVGILTAALIALPLTACQVEDDSPARESTDGPSAAALPTVKKVDDIAAMLPKDIKDSGQLRIVMTTSSPPAHFTTDEGLEGLDHDLGVLIGEVLGVKTEFIGIPIDQVIPGFQSGKYDLVISQFSPTVERAKVLDFVDYAQSGTSLAVRSDTNDVDINSMCGKSIAAQKGSVQAIERIPEFDEKCKDEGKPAISTKTFRDTTEALLALRSSRVDGVLADGPVNGYAAKQSDGKVKIAGDLPGEPVSIGSIKGSDLSEPVQAALKELASDSAYSAVFENWGMEGSEITDFAINNVQKD